MKKLILIISLISLGIVGICTEALTNVNGLTVNVNTLESEITGEQWQEIRYWKKENNFLKDYGYYVLIIAVMLGVYTVYVVRRKNRK